MKRAQRLGPGALVVLLVACAGEPGEPAPLEIETVEVGAPVDEGLSTEEDEKGRPPPDSGWILSGMLPEDLPLHRPARLVGSGDAEGGRTYFVFHTQTRLEQVRDGLARRLPEAGWRTGATAGGLSAEKGGERVEFVFSPLRPGTEIRVVY